MLCALCGVMVVGVKMVYSGVEKQALSTKHSGLGADSTRLTGRDEDHQRDLHAIRDERQTTDEKQTL